MVPDIAEVPARELVPHMGPDNRTSGMIQRLLKAGQLQLALRELEHEEVILHGSLWLTIKQSHPLVLVVPD